MHSVVDITGEDVSIDFNNSDEVAKAMLEYPELWADLFIFQNETIEELEEMLDAYQVRLELVLRDPDEFDH